MIETPAMTPITIPAIAPPEREDPEELTAAAVVDLFVVVVAEVSVEDAEDVDVEVAVVTVGVEEGTLLSVTAAP